MAAVLFVENSKEGELAKGLRRVIERIKHILGYTIKVVERSGTPLRLMFPLTKIKEGKECGRDDCTTCMQESKGEKVPSCRKRSVMYENVCLRCNPGTGGEESKKVTPPTYPPSIWLELTRTGIPIRRMSPKRLHSGPSHAVIFYRNCMGFFAFGQKLPWER